MNDIMTAWLMLQFGLGGLVGVSSVKIFQAINKKTYHDGYMEAVNNCTEMIDAIARSKRENNEQIRRNPENKESVKNPEKK